MATHTSEFMSAVVGKTRVHGRPPRAVEGSTSKKVSGLQSEVLKAG